VIFRLVDIGGIVAYHCLKFLFINLTTDQEKSSIGQVESINVATVVLNSRGRGRMVVGFTPTYATTNVVSSYPAHGEVYSMIQQYMIRDRPFNLQGGVMVFF